ncbi:response regulator [Ammoniphilus sp. 3BR4]|uniref:response regulator n=1 Tax=Ammoniphilus sp. 3BR4 TaxID=3158265 RepID=UPI00346528AC
MNLSYFIVDDDSGSRRMLERIIADDELGEVIGSAPSGQEAVPQILLARPDIVLIDLLMPDMDGIETMERLKNQNFSGQFIMISQVVNKDMVGEAYLKGVEFFIHKPINRTEVRSILQKIAEQVRLKQSLLAIKQSLAGLDHSYTAPKKASKKETVLSILNDMGIAGEAGCGDIVAMMEYLLDNQTAKTAFPPLKELYEAIARKTKSAESDVKKESRAIEQRVRRTIFAAISNLASIGSMDYAHPKFEYYAPRFFDFQDIRIRMKELEEEGDISKVKLNIKKFLMVLYLETLEKMDTGYKN